eukprot:s2835_g5.t1
MSPKRIVKETKKIQLKLKPKNEKVIDKNEANKIVDIALNAKSSSSITFRNFLDGCDLDSLNRLDEYLRHDKTPMARKLEALALFTGDVVRLNALKDLCETAAQQISDLIHDTVIKECGGNDNPEEFDVELLKSKVSKKIGELDSKQMSD